MAGKEVTSAISRPGVGMWQLCLGGLNFVSCCCICLSTSYLKIKLVQKQTPNAMSLSMGHPGAAVVRSLLGVKAGISWCWGSGFPLVQQAQCSAPGLCRDAKWPRSSWGFCPQSLSSEQLHVGSLWGSGRPTGALPPAGLAGASGPGMSLGGGRRPRAGAGMGAPEQNLGSVRCSMAEGAS